MGAVVFLDVPGVQNVLKLRKEIKKQEQAFVEKQELVSKIENLKEVYETRGEEFKKISHILPLGEDVPSLIIQLEALALEGGLVLEDISFSVYTEESAVKNREAPQKEEVVKDYQTLLINLKLIGDYSAFKNFLKAAEENIRLMDIISVNFSTVSKEMISLFEFNLNLKTYNQ